jgi:hypothetical protein
MKRGWIAGLLLMSVMGLELAGAGDVWQELGVGRSDAEKNVVDAFAYGSVSTGRVAKVFRAASPELRAQLVEQVLVWTKAYVNSAQFRKEYATKRSEAKPVADEIEKSVDEELQERRDQRKADLEETKKSIAEMDPQYRKAAEDGYKAAVEAMKQLDTPEYRKMEREGLMAERKSAQEDFEQRTKEWEDSYPADPTVLVKQRLEQFLEATDDVDFGAKTAAKWGKQRFVNEQYESKPSEWKVAYRAGKEPTEKARAFARAWLAELQ